MLRHLRSNLIAYVALFLALSGGSFAVAALNRHDKRVIKKLVNKQITRRAPGLSVNQANTANEATHAGSADAVGGVSVAPVRIALPDGADPTDVVRVNDTSVRVFSCGGGNVSLQIVRPNSASSPQLVAEWALGAGSATNHLPPASAIAHGEASIGLSASIREGSGQVTRVLIDGFYEQNAFGGTDDCFVQGTIQRFG